MIMKAMMKVTMGLSVLLTLAGCREREELASAYDNEVANEVAFAFFRGRGGGSGLYYFEERCPQNPGAYEVFLSCSPHSAQAYRIENYTVTRYRFLTRSDNRPSEDALYALVMQGDRFMSEIFQQLPNTLKLDGAAYQVSNDDHCVTIINMENKAPDSDAPFLEDMVNSHGRWIRKWVGSPKDIPTEINAFRQRVVQVLSASESAIDYPAYIRAVPLLTKEELDAEKATPLIELGRLVPRQFPKLAQCAVGHPYVLFPVHEDKQLFSRVKDYTPGDKFKVRRKGYDGKMCYYIIETFAGGSEKF